MALGKWLRMNKGNLKPMKIIQLVIFVLFIAGFLSPVRAAGKDTGANMDAYGMAQADNDSIIAPNVFTPNDDGKNDVFEVTSLKNNEVSLKVFTRAGALVFSIQAKRCRWDGCSLSGQRMATGVYYYTAEVPGSSPKVSKCGFVHLYR